MVTKQCTKCQIPKDLLEFGNFSRGAGGKKSICKDCISLMNRSRYEKKKNTILEKNKQWDKTNEQYLKQYKAEYYQKNKDKKL